MFDIIKELYNCVKVYGPYVGDDGRNRCVLYFKDGTTSSRSYARLILEARLNRLLTDDEQADHIDDDPTNDDPINLQVLTKEQNLIKQSYKKIEESTSHGYECYVCGNPFILLPGRVRTRILVNKNDRAICSVECKYKNDSELKSIPVSKQQEIKRLSELNKSTKEIANVVGVSDWTVRKYSRR